MENSPKYFSLIGAFVLNIVLLIQLCGIILTTGTLGPYLTSYFRVESPEITTGDVFSMAPSSVLGDTFGMRNFYLVLSSLLVLKLGLRPTIFLAVVLVSSSIISMSFVSSIYLLDIVTIIMGIGCGLMAMSTLWNAIQYFPRHQGLIAGVVQAGYGAGPSILAPVISVLINPEDFTPEVLPDSVLYPEEVNKRVSSSLIILGLGFALFGLIAVLMTKEIKKSRTEYRTKGKIFTSKNFWLLFFAVYFGFVWWGSLLMTYKSFGMKFLKRDLEISYAGSVASIFGISGRIFWPYLADFYGARKIMLSIVGVCIGIAGVFYWSTGSVWFFGGFLSMGFFVSSGINPTLAIAVVEVFGKDLSAKVFSYFYVSVTLAGVSIWVLIYLVGLVGYFWLWMICAFCLSVSFVSIWLVDIRRSKIEELKVELIQE